MIVVIQNYCIIIIIDVVVTRNKEPKELLTNALMPLNSLYTTPFHYNCDSLM